jgi:hypothetical protein
MLYDAHGQPIRSISMRFMDGFMERFAKDEMTSQEAFAAGMRVLDLRASLGVNSAMLGPRIGDTITVRHPDRFAKKT